MQRAASQYSVNRLNQYTSRTVAGTSDVLGIANPTAGVTVNGNTANRHGEYFHWPLAVNNSSALYTNVSVISLYGGHETNSGYVQVPPATETYLHDADGNLVSDGLWTNTWDAENRLIKMESLSSYPTEGKRRLTFDYDAQGRRIRKQVWKNNVLNTLIWNQISDERFVYDGWNLIAKLDTNLTSQATFVWGLDLSGSLQGAGGVGGLLVMSEVAGGSITNACFAAYDGNGNVAALLHIPNCSFQARYEYGPFAEPLRATGAMAKKNPFRFSTKYQDDETDLLYYGYRYYHASVGRWLRRDPLEERTDHNVKCFVGNEPISHIDKDGRVTVLPAIPTTGPCGGYSIYWTFILDRAAPIDGYIVQHVVVRDKIALCSGKPKINNQEFYEAFPVAQGVRNAPPLMSPQGIPYTDSDINSGVANTWGYHFVLTEIKFFTMDTIVSMEASGFNAGTVPQAGPTAMSTFFEPSWWHLSPDNGETTASRYASARWSCCCGENQYNIFNFRP